MNKIFQIGDRVSFIHKYSEILYGNVIAMDHEGQRLCIQGDDCKEYERWSSEVVKLNKDIGEQ